MVIQNKELSICEGRYIDIPDDIWIEVMPRIRNIKVISRERECVLYVSFVSLILIENV